MYSSGVLDLPDAQTNHTLKPSLIFLTPACVSHDTAYIATASYHYSKKPPNRHDEAVYDLLLLPAHTDHASNDQHTTDDHEETLLEPFATCCRSLFLLMSFGCQA